MEKINFQTKSDIIYQELKQDIINGKYKPRERIVISSVAKQFGSSDIPVREALKQLESDGLIKNTPYVGAVVTSFNFEDIQKIYQVRTVLEGLAARMATDHVKQNDILALDKSVAHMKKAIEAENFFSLAQLNFEYHHTIYSASRNEYLNKIIFEIWNVSSRSRAIFVLVPDRARAAVKEHIAILEALKKGDGIETEKLIFKHNESALNAVELYLKQNVAGKAGMSADMAIS